jgi:pimeloyl-ACP methyl ester carboxylesterase
MAAQTYFRCSGPTDAPALLLLHPRGARHEFWDACVALWSRDFRIVACDLRGAGRSPIPDRPWAVGDHVRDLIAIREELELTDVIPVGCAIGSIIAAAYAGADRAHVRALVLANTAPRLGLESKQRTEGRVAQVRAGGMDVLLPGVIDLAFNNLPRDERYHRYTEMFRKNDPDGYASLALGMIGTDVSEALAALDCPSLVVVGRHDILLPPDLSRAVHGLLTGSEFIVIDSGAHFVPYQAPEIFAGLVSDFLARRARPSFGNSTRR